MIIGILQTGHLPEEIQSKGGNLDALFMRLLDRQGFTFRTFPVIDMVFPAGPEAADAWLITGSKHGAYEDHPFIPPLENLIRAIRDAGPPLIGICFGHQIIAQALGGTVEKFSGGWSVGRQSYQMGGREIMLNAWHQDQVTTLPEGAEVIGHSDFCANAMVTYGDRIMTVQAHPEFDIDHVRGLIAHRGAGVIPDAQLDQARRDLSKPVDNADMAAMMVAVLKQARADA